MEDMCTAKNGECISSWLDSWIYEKNHWRHYSQIYELYENKEVSVAQVKKGEIVVILGDG